MQYANQHYFGRMKKMNHQSSIVKYLAPIIQWRKMIINQVGEMEILTNIKKNIKV